MRRFLAIVLISTLTLCGCANSNLTTDIDETSQIENKEDSLTTKAKDEQPSSDANVEEEDIIVEIPEEEKGDDSYYEYSPEFESLDDEDLLKYVEDDIYAELVGKLNNDRYYVENVHAVYVSKEYLEEVSYNSQSNIFFGYTLEDIQNVYGDTKFVFTLGDNGETVVEPFEDYDDTYEQIIKNVAIGTGVILVCVTVSVVTAGASAPAVSLIFAASAKTGTIMALSSGTLSGVATGIITGMETGDMQEAVKAGALAGSDSFKWGAISGAIAGGASETVKYAKAMSALKGVPINLTTQQAAAIQMETGYPAEVIAQFHSMEEYEVFKNAGLKAAMVNGETALIRKDIDLKLVDEYGRTNLERMKQGLAPLKKVGEEFEKYELHHIGQEADATLAILTQTEHDNAALHLFKTVSEIDRSAFDTVRKNFWKTMATMLESGAV